LTVKTRALTVEFPETMLSSLATLAEKTGRSRGAIVRDAVSALLAGKTSRPTALEQLRPLVGKVNSRP